MSPHILSLLLCLVPACAVALPTDSLSIVWKDSTQLQISFPLSAGDARPGSDYRLFVTPRLCSAGGDTLNLSTVEFAGTRNKKYNDRAAHLAGQARPTVYRADETMTYQATVPVEPWMKQGELTLSLGREREGCCDAETLPAQTLATTRYVRPFVPMPRLLAPRLSVAEQIAKREAILRPIEDYRPYNPAVPLRKMKGALYVHFPINKADLREDYMNNRETLQKIVSMMQRIQTDSTSSVTKIVIIGLASPEGPLAFNNRLAGQRAKALKEYVDKQVPMPAEVYEVINGGEAWADLRDVIDESDLAEREEMLRIIDQTPDVNRREQLLRRLNGGKPYRYLARNVFVSQRNSGYIQVYYEAVPDTGAEAINQAVALIESKQYQAAADLLQPLVDERKWNTLGVAYYMLGRKQQAQECFQKAVEQGNEDARKNLEECESTER